MTITIWWLFLGTILLMMSTPGPSHLLILSTSLSNGFRRSLATAAGDLSANIIQILLAGFGLAAILAKTKYGFTIIKWGGVAYLIWIGVRTLLNSLKNKKTVSAPRSSLQKLYWRGFITSAANPKAVVFFAALFPQFINPANALIPQILILGGTYIVIDGAFLTAYAMGGSWLAEKITSDKRAWVERIAGTSLIGAAILLGLKAR